MNLLIDGLPDSVEIAGQEVSIDTSFRTGILFEEMMLDGSMDDMEKLRTSLDLYFPSYDFDLDVVPEAVAALLWFYRCGADGESKEDSQSGTPAKDPPYSYEYDADYIYAAFLGSYGIDLARASLHWWQFRALFRSLPEDTQFMKIVGYRSVDKQTLSKMSKDQRQHITKMQKLFALPLSADRQQLESDLTQILMNGGNPSAITSGG
ncbi:MAG: hypothetical protein HXK09_01015 [Actinomyces bouchesdurhonensis]|uniref:Bacteriophage Gp15 protein n=1 Tax=Actinomyces bouchesdurhonensis TaxID=1852361 RepID=A0A929RNJ1_9ACTO|nr:hypothetical protein [Actinomyces bouchesdurhonensis]